MSRSYRKPYWSVTGSCSAKEDKRLAARGVRRTQDRRIRDHGLDEDFVLPVRLECTHNNVYGWSRDGKQMYSIPKKRAAPSLAPPYYQVVYYRGRLLRLLPQLEDLEQAWYERLWRK